MKVLILGAAGFIGTNLVLSLVESQEMELTLFDKSFFNFPKELLIQHSNRINYIEGDFSLECDFDSMIREQDMVYHLISTTVPTTSNSDISAEIIHNVSVTVKLLDSCVRNNVNRFIFLSSGGTVYGKDDVMPVSETAVTNPISSYGIQKLTIEKLLYLYNYTAGLDYRIIRLSNPYGPYQRPNGILGVVTTFTYKALHNEPIIVYGDGSVIRDFIYIDDAIKGIRNIVQSDCAYKLFNLGNGYGTSIREVLEVIQDVLNIDFKIDYQHGRKVDVAVNYLDISRYEEMFGKLDPISLPEGIKRTADFMLKKV